ncbi:MAG TPA: pyridoxamine 5-phosphate oxidase, partial [Mycobacterium sp.]
DSTIGKTMGKKRYKSSTTTRNLRTLVKVLGAQPSS